MKILLITLFLIFFSTLLAGVAMGQKKVAELTLVYNYALISNGQTNPSFTASNTYYIKGNMSCAEMTSSMFSAVTIYDANAGTAVVLREVSGQKLLIRMNADNWEDKNKRFAGLSFTRTADSKVIAGYKCDKATAVTKDGFTISVFYTKDIIPANKDYDPTFKNLDGLPMEYELSNGQLTIRNTLVSMNLNPVPASKFDIPKSGYREMTYDESKKLNVGG
ncbi:MAG TPA: hypothetical protein VMI35_12765 [Puia sp.]|nr:hypothetical protein [Puia sp.]